ncbi:hypothetical protein GOBAR_AA04651 [Gossypium barbadense]|uniref:Uncharacterized protein n=1 Tax=Gossypium barbadense TaxID=3634 RepID=A0A2P5YJZ5_GOSBA|nr:hypothetical protein GOBAR_AA04651 [Gossypium barbadense]
MRDPQLMMPSDKKMDDGQISFGLKMQMPKPGLEGSDGFMRDEIVEIKSCGNKNSVEKEDESQKKKRGIMRNKWDGKKKGVRKLNEALKLGQIEASPSGVFGPEMKRSGLK